MIDSLVKKPMAFYHSQLRDAMLPNEDYRQIWRHLSETLTSRDASKMMVNLLNIAAKYACESALSEIVIDAIAQGKPIDLEQIKMQFCPQSKNEIPELNTVQHSLSVYNQLIQSEIKYAVH
jgi:hypothetical protein